MYAVIRDRSRQFQVRAGDKILIDRNKKLEPGQEIVFTEVCLVGGDNPRIGTPLVAGASVVGKVLGMVKGKKLEVGKFRRRKNYRRRAGHRQHYEQVEIKEIRA